MITIKDNKLIIEINTKDPKQELHFIQISLIELMKDYFAENEHSNEAGEKKDFYPLINLLCEMQRIDPGSPSHEPPHSTS